MNYLKDLFLNFFGYAAGLALSFLIAATVIFALTGWMVVIVLLVNAAWYWGAGAFVTWLACVKFLTMDMRDYV